MKSLALFPDAPETSPLGYGTTSMMGTPSTKDRLALLECAFDNGITHFDTAPYYGYGESERVLGEFLAGKRDRVTVTTKYGIAVSGVVRKRWVNLLARRIFSIFPGLKTVVKRQAPAMSARAPFTAEGLRASLERSLLALRTDHVDLFLLHEPLLADAASEEVHAFLEGETKRGSVRACGSGGGPDIEKIAAARMPTSRWLQFEDSPGGCDIDAIRSNGGRCITFGAFNVVLPRLRRHFDAHPQELPKWSTRLGIDCDDPQALAGLVQSAAHLRNSGGIVLFSTRNPERIASAARVAEGGIFTPSQVSDFCELTGTVDECQENRLTQRR